MNLAPSLVPRVLQSRTLIHSVPDLEEREQIFLGWPSIWDPVTLIRQQRRIHRLSHELDLAIAPAADIGRSFLIMLRESEFCGDRMWAGFNLTLRSCGFYINSTKHSENKWGSSFFGESSQSCSSSHDTLFGCTNTPFTDQNGEPEGDVVFINTNCTSNERLLEGQDPRYYSLFALETDDAEISVSISRFEQEVQTPDPSGDETCFRACLCGYTETGEDGSDAPASTPAAPYQVCNCTLMLALYILDRTDIAERIYMTSANITLFQYYGMIPCDAKVGQSGNFSGILDFRWVAVPDNDSMMKPLEIFDNGIPENISIADAVIKNDYECFDSFENIKTVIFNFIYQSYRDHYSGRLISPSHGVCFS